MEKLSEKALKSTLRDNFNRLNQIKNISRFKDTLSRTVFKNILSSGFNRINKRKERVIKATLSISLLSTLISQLKNTEKRNIVRRFVQNKTKHVAA